MLRGGDLPSLRVDLEEGDVFFVGDLADQGVVQLSVGGHGVIPVRGKHAGKWCTWNETKNTTLTLAGVGFYLNVFAALVSSNVPAGFFSLTRAV